MLDHTQIEAFHRDGVLVLAGLLDPHEVAALRTAVDTTIAEGLSGTGSGHGYRTVDGHRRYYRTDGVWDRHRAFRDITVKPQLLAAVGQLIGHPFMPVNDSIVVKLPGSGVPIRWHQDPPYDGLDGRADTHPVPNFDVDIYLDEATTVTGCLHALPGHHLVGHVDIERFTDDQLFAHPLAVPLELRPGDVLVHAITTPHGSRANDGNHPRRVLYLHYMARDVLDDLHPEWSDRNPFGPDQLTWLSTIIDDADTRAAMATHDIHLGPQGLTYTGLPTTPRHHWQQLADQQPAPLRHERKTLTTPRSPHP